MRSGNRAALAPARLPRRLGDPSEPGADPNEESRRAPTRSRRPRRSSRPTTGGRGRARLDFGRRQDDRRAGRAARAGGAGDPRCDQGARKGAALHVSSPAQRSRDPVDLARMIGLGCSLPRAERDESSIHFSAAFVAAIASLHPRRVDRDLDARALLLQQHATRESRPSQPRPSPRSSRRARGCSAHRHAEFAAERVCERHVLVRELSAKAGGS